VRYDEPPVVPFALREEIDARRERLTRRRHPVGSDDEAEMLA
jgi:hypothetical protein